MRTCFILCTYYFTLYRKKNVYKFDTFSYNLKDEISFSIRYDVMLFCCRVKRRMRSKKNTSICTLIESYIYIYISIPSKIVVLFYDGLSKKVPVTHFGSIAVLCLFACPVTLGDLNLLIIIRPATTLLFLSLLKRYVSSFLKTVDWTDWNILQKKKKLTINK